MHTVAQSDSALPKSGSSEDYREYFINIFTNSELAQQHGVLTQELAHVEETYQLLNRRYLIERSMNAKAVAQLIPRHPTAEDNGSAIAILIAVGVLLFGFLMGGVAGLVGLLGTWGLFLFLLFAKFHRSGRDCIEPVDIPGGRSSDMNDN
jgi:hypothetical protein